jgi:hypothetical protein
LSLLTALKAAYEQEKNAYPQQNLALHFELVKTETTKNGRFQQIFLSRIDFTVEEQSDRGIRWVQAGRFYRHDRVCHGRDN